MVKGFMTAVLLLGLNNVNLGNPGDPIRRIAGLYQKGDSLFQLSNNTPATDRLAIDFFDRVIDELQPLPEGPGKDTLRFQSWLKKGILLDSRFDYSGAKTAYTHALAS